MIEEKTRRSKANPKMKIGVCAKSIQSPIVVLQRLNIGVNNAALAKEAVTDKQNDSVKVNKREAPYKAGPKSKKPVLRNSSVASSDHLGNEKANSDPIQTVTEPESTVSGLDDGAALSKTKSYKFKKKLKRLDKEPLGMVTDKKLSEKIKEDPKLLTDAATTEIKEMSKVTVSTRRKVAEKAKAADDEKCTVNNDAKQLNSNANSSQEKVSSEVAVNDSTLVNDAIATEETTQVKPSISTRSRLLKNTEVGDFKKSIQDDSSSSNVSQLVDNKLLPCENKLQHSNNSTDSSSIDNNVRKSLSHKTRLRQSKVDGSAVKDSNESLSVEKIVSTIKTTDTVETNDAQNTIKTRNKGQEKAKSDVVESSPVLKSIPKQISNKTSLNEQPVEHEAKEINSKDIQDNKTISTRSKLSETKKTDECDKLLDGNETTKPKQSDLVKNVSKVQTGRKSLRVEKTQDNSKLSADIVSEKDTPVKSKDSARNSLQDKTKPGESNNIKTRRSVIGDKSAESVQADSDTKASQMETNSHSSEKVSTRSSLQGKTIPDEGKKIKTRRSVIESKSAELVQANSDIKTSQMEINSHSKKEVAESKLINKVPTRSKVLRKEKIDSDKSNELVQPKENNSAPSSSAMEIDTVSSISVNVDNSAISSQAEEKINEKKRMSTRSKALDKNDVTDSEKKITESSSAMEIDTVSSISENVDNSASSSQVEEKTNEKKRMSTRSKAVDISNINDSEKKMAENNILQTDKSLTAVEESSKPKASNRKSISTRSKSIEKTKVDDKNISTRSKSTEKIKVDDNKKEKSSIDVTVQSEHNQNASPPNKVQISNELPQSEKSVDSPKRLNPTKTPNKTNTQSARSTRSQAEKKVTDDLQKSIVEKEIAPIQPTEPIIPNDTVQDSSKLLTDTPKTKENTPAKSKTREKKNENKRDEVQANSKPSPVDSVVSGDTENKISTRSKNGLENGALETTKPSEAVVNDKSVKAKNVQDSPKQLADKTKTPKKIVVKTTISTRSKPLEKYETEIRDEYIVENGTASIEQNQSLSESALNADNSKSVTPDIEDSNKTISTRSGLVCKTKTDVKPLERKRKSVAEKNRSPAKSQMQTESIVNKKISPQKDCNEQEQQQVCEKKKVVIKLFRCDDQAEPVVCSPVKETPTKKTPKGKRKAEKEAIVEGTPKSKKSKRLDFSDNSDVPATNETQTSGADSQVPLASISENADQAVVESQSNVESDIHDTEIAESVVNVSENLEEAEKDLEEGNEKDVEKEAEKDPQMDLDINIVDNTTSSVTTASSVDKSPAVSKKDNHCDKLVENETEIIVNISGDNISVHGEELLEDRDEGISVDTSENEANTETFINNDNQIVAENTSVIRDKDINTSLARNLVEEVINDWDVADDDKTDDIDNNGVNQDVTSPEVIQIDDNDDIEMIDDTPQEAVSIEKEKNTRKTTSHNVNVTPRKNPTITSIDISHSPLKETEKSIQGKRHTDKDTPASTSEHTSEMSEIEELDDSNFESVDESSCTEIFANENDQQENVSQETITYYNSEDISMDVGASANDNGLNDVVMNLKDACDKITADLSAVTASYEHNQEAPIREAPELLCISDDSNDEPEKEPEEEEEVMIIEPPPPPRPLIQRPETPLAEQRSLLISNQIRQALQGTPSISVIKASELLQTPEDYPIKPTGQHVVYPQRQMHSTTLLPASFITDPIDIQNSPSFTEDTIMKCPKCRCEFVGKSRLRRHWLTCGDAMYLHCPFCPCKVKHRRSLVNHLNSQHMNQVTYEDAVKIAEQVVKQTREAAGVKLKQGTHRAVRDFLQTSSNIPIIQLPDFIRIQCVVCNKNYDEIPATYKKTCDNCSTDLMTTICNLCNKQYMLSTKIGLHVQGNCIYSGRIQCRECDFVASGKYNLQEHIIRKHIFVPPEDYVVCGLGCGKTFRVHEALKKHERICGKEANLDCRFCDYKTKHRSAMKMHVQQHIVNDKLTINNDGTVKLFGQPARNESEDDVRDLITEQQVRSVIRVHCSRCKRNLRLTSNRSSCEFCKLSFQFSCSRCSDTIRLDSLHAARLHVIRSHSVKIHECPQCLEKFSYVYDLTRHASKCTANSIFCCEYCSYRTNQEPKLRDHQRRIHFKTKACPYSCKKCNKPFHRMDSLKRHEKLNCGVMPSFSCEHCQFKTKTKFSLLRHIQTQHAYIYENFSFVCDRCNQFYTNMFTYEEHVKNCHALAIN